MPSNMLPKDGCSHASKCFVEGGSHSSVPIASSAGRDRSSDSGLHSRGGRSIVLMLAGIASVVTNDSLIKLASQAMPLSEMMVIRGCFAIVFLLGLSLLLRVPLRRSSFVSRLVLLRAGMDVLITITFLVGLTKLPLANATALYMATPLILTLLAVAFFKQQVSAGRWSVILAGFGGVLLVVQPAGEDFNVWSLLIICAAVLTAVRDLVLISVQKDIPSLVITLVSMVMVVVFAAVWSLFQDWQVIDLKHYALLAAASVFLSGGFFLTTIALREGEMRILAPLRFSHLVFSVIIGFLVWGDVPNTLAFCGMALIMAAGIYLVRR